MHAITISEKRVLNLKKRWGIEGRVWREVRERKERKEKERERKGKM